MQGPVALGIAALPTQQTVRNMGLQKPNLLKVVAEKGVWSVVYSSCGHSKRSGCRKRIKTGQSAN